MTVDRALFESKVDRSGERHRWLGARTAAGHGVIKVVGRIGTAAQVAWELGHGELPAGARLRGCSDEPSCVRLDHLSLRLSSVTNPAETAAPRARAKRGGGSITSAGPNRWKVTIDAGRDEHSERRRPVRVVHGSSHRRLGHWPSCRSTSPTPPPGPLDPMALSLSMVWLADTSTLPVTSVGWSTRPWSATGRSTTGGWPPRSATRMPTG